MVVAEVDTPSIAALADIYARLKTKPERHVEELKSYSLTEANAATNAAKLAETIAGIANHGESFGFIVFADSGIANDGPIDGAKLDDLISKTVHPRIMVTLDRQEIDGNTVDFLIIPRSNHRPHIVRGSDGRYYVPFRGIANNSTAARAELDAIYRERTIDMIRQVIPGISIGDEDTLGKYVDRIGYGLGQSDVSQLAFVVVPSTVPKRLIIHSDLLSFDALRSSVTQLAIQAMNASDQQGHWFIMNHGISPIAQEDYAEIVQVSVVDEGKKSEYLWGARIYLTGAVTYSTVMWPTEVATPPGSFPVEWFTNMASTTLTFAHLVFEHFDLAIDELNIRALITKADGLQLSRRGPVDFRIAGALKSPQPSLLIPSHEPITSTRTTLKAEIPSIVNELGRILVTHFNFRNNVLG